MRSGRAVSLGSAASVSMIFPRYPRESCFKWKVTMRSLLMSVASVSSFVLAASAGASVVTSNLGETRFGDNRIDGGDSPSSLANRFTVGAGTWGIDGVAVSVRDITPSTPDRFQLQIRNDASGAPGLTALASFDMAANDVGGSFATYTYSPFGTLTLAAGSYWLVATPTASSTFVQWADTDSTSATSVNGWSIDDRQWQARDTTGTAWTRDNNQVRHQFAISATAIPEPTSLAALALSPLVLNRRRTSL